MGFSKNLALLETLLKTLTSLYLLSVIPAPDKIIRGQAPACFVFCHSREGGDPGFSRSSMYKTDKGCLDSRRSLPPNGFVGGGNDVIEF